MTRRALLSGSPLFARPRAIDAPIPIVTDVGKLNSFVEAYNAYAGQLRRGVVDLRLWNQFVSAFRKLTQ